MYELSRSKHDQQEPLSLPLLSSQCYLHQPHGLKTAAREGNSDKPREGHCLGVDGVQPLDLSHQASSRTETHHSGIGTHELWVKGDPGEPLLRCEASAYPDVSVYTCCESLPADPQSLQLGRGRGFRKQGQQGNSLNRKVSGGLKGPGLGRSGENGWILSLPANILINSVEAGASEIAP